MLSALHSLLSVLSLFFGFSVEARNGLGLPVGNVVVDGVVVGNGLGLADLGLGLPISAWACRSRPGLAVLDDLGLSHS